jgi:hypothetical protein
MSHTMDGREDLQPNLVFTNFTKYNSDACTLCSQITTPTFANLNDHIMSHLKIIVPLGDKTLK